MRASPLQLINQQNSLLWFLAFVYVPSNHNTQLQPNSQFDYWE